MAKTKHRERCPYCNNKGRKVVVHVGGLGYPVYAVHCPHCGSETDDWDERADAWNAWDEVSVIDLRR